MKQPLVTCIMPTADRRKFLTSALDNFLQQDYPNLELIIVDDGVESCADLIPEIYSIRYFYTTPLGTIGIKRNFACKKANGEIIVHWDDDDWYAPDWVSQQVNALLASGADISGLSSFRLYSPTLERNFVYEISNEDELWLCGATLAFKKSLWYKYPFANLQIGEDCDFLTNSGGKINVLDYFDGFIAGLHTKNTSIKYIESIIPKISK